MDWGDRPSTNAPEPASDRDRPMSHVLASYAFGLLMRPASGWDRIAATPMTIRDILKRQVAPLAAIPAVCAALGLMIFPLQILDLRYKPPLHILVAEALVGYLLAFVQVITLALILDLLAPAFGGARDRNRAVKIAAFAATPMWLAGVFMLAPSIGWLIALLGGLYSLFLLYVGLMRLMRPAPDKALSYFALVLIAALAVGILTGSVLTWVRELGGPIAISVSAPQT